MTEFTLFEKAQKKYETEISSKNAEIPEDTSSSCSHENTITEKGVNVCVDCGEEIHQEINCNKEWRYYGNKDNKRSSDPNRVQMRKSEERSIFKDVENLGLSDKVIAHANKIYAQVTKNKIFRSNSRKAIVFACVFHAYKICGNPQTHEKLISIFGIGKKVGLQGLKHVSLNAPKNSNIRTTHITPVNLIGEVMEKFSCSKEQEQEVITIYNKIKNRSSKLNRSRPQTVAYGLVYYWIKLTGKNISLQEFCKQVSLSDITITKAVKEIESILDMSNNV